MHEVPTDFSFGYSAPLGYMVTDGHLPKTYKTIREYVGKDGASNEVRFTLYEALEGRRVSLDYGGLTNWLMNVGKINIGGKSRYIGSYHVLND